MKKNRTVQGLDLDDRLAGADALIRSWKNADWWFVAQLRYQHDVPKSETRPGRTSKRPGSIRLVLIRAKTEEAASRRAMSIGTRSDGTPCEDSRGKVLYIMRFQDVVEVSMLDWPAHECPREIEAAWLDLPIARARPQAPGAHRNRQRDRGCVG